MKFPPLFSVFILLLFINTQNLMAQEVLSNDPFEKEWQEIDSLVQNGLVRSAKEAIIDFRKLAQRKGETAHAIKALLYLAQMNTQLEESGDWKAIVQMENDLAEATNRQEPILASLLAEMYFNYYQRNQWQLRDRTATNEAPTDDETTWTAGDFIQRSTDLYLRSLKSESTKTQTLEQFGAIVQKGLNRDGVYTVVYELLLDKAILHFSRNDAFLNEPSYDSAFDDSKLLAPSDEFIAIKWPEVEQKSSSQYLIEVLQTGLKWKVDHYDATKSQSVVDFDLRRLKIIYQQLQVSTKEKAYEESLDLLLSQYNTSWQGQQPIILLAQMDYWKNRGNYYNSDDADAKNLKWALRKARTIGVDIQSRFPKSIEAKQAAYLQAAIEQQNLSINIESVQLPNEYGLLSIDYKNIDQLHFRIAPLTVDEYQNKANEKETLERILARPALQKWTEKLPDVGDYRSHRTESSFAGLAVGVYSLVVSHDADFSMKDDNPLAFIHFWVSELGLLTQMDYSQESRFLVVNRRTGAPVEGANIHLWELNNRQVNKKTASYTSDQNGMATIDEKKRQTVRVEITKGDDRIFPTQNHWLQGSYRIDESAQQKQIHFFLDRGLYRPGQTLYFKALVVNSTKGLDHKIVANETLTITLFDANNQKVKDLEVTTNAFGSAAGSFTLPSGGLLGQMSIRTNTGNQNSQYFSVEEYKRPRFEAVLDSLEGEAKLGDVISIKGEATAYAGPAIADAEVIYTVTRTHYYPWYRWGYPSSSGGQSIAQGKTQTNINGHFEFDFEAIPDASLQSEHLPNYRFNIKVDVIDQSGETRSANKMISIAKHPLELAVKMEAEQDRNEKLEINITSNNLDGKAVAVKGQLSIERLDVPEKEWVRRYWSVPDTFMMSQTVFDKQFPHYLYRGAVDPSEQPVLGMIWQENIEIDGDLAVNLDTKNWDVGHYKVRFEIITNDGDQLDVVQFFQLNDWSTKQFASGHLLNIKIDETPLQPGDLAEMFLGSKDQQHHVLTTIGRGNDKLEERWLHPNDNQDLSYLLKETDRGGIFINNLFVRYNRVFLSTYNVKVPWSNKDLKITYETFRSKLYPGDEEEWVIKIDGPGKDKVAAELLGAMYDASLDQIKPFEWQFNIFPNWWNGLNRWNAYYFQSLNVRSHIPYGPNRPGAVRFQYPSLLSQNNRSHYTNYMADGMGLGAVRSSAPAPMMNKSTLAFGEESEEADMAVTSQSMDSNAGGETEPETTGGTEKPPLKIRKDLSETAFFFPQLQTDEQGRVALLFKAPEALTRWKLQLFAHSQDLAFALSEETAVTQKELMVLPNAPRFLRQGDQIQFATKVSNLSDKSLAGTCRLELFDVETNASLNVVYSLSENELPFDIAANESGHIDWAVKVPEDAMGIVGYRVIATAGTFSDGEEAAIPILTNKVLLTETLPLFVRPNKKRSFELKHLTDAKPSTQHQAFTLEMTTNPAWMALKALPYLQEYPYDCTEQLVNKYFANALASKLVVDIPKLQSVFEKWKGDPNALKSPLMQNEELKSALLEETPWVMEAQSENEQRERIALLFDLDRMAAEQQSTLAKIKERQKNNGAFSWFTGGRDSWYITQYVVEQLTHLKALVGDEKQLLPEDALARAVAFCDGEAYDHYSKIKARGIDDDLNYLSPIIAHYLYIRSYHLDVTMNENHREAYDFWWAEAEAHVMAASLQTQALLTIAAKQSKRTVIAKRIYASLRERALHSQELGMYWKYDAGYYWHQLPVETHTLLIETFELMGASIEEIDELKIWLLRQKETNRWETTKATAAAVYALMTTGNDWISADGDVSVTFPNWEKSAYQSQVTEAESTAEAGTGYYKVRWPVAEVDPGMGLIQLKNRSKVPAWGGIYWQYFEQIDQADVFVEGPMKLERKIYRKVNTDQGALLEELTTSPSLGDQLTVRLTIRTDRDMEFVHLKDLRASGLEPIQQLSKYRHQGGLGYYQSTTDLGTHFFFDRLPKGEYVLEYDLRVFHRGDFSGGLATLQCMYAPKFSSHSEGVRVQVR